MDVLHVLFTNLPSTGHPVRLITAKLSTELPAGALSPDRRHLFLLLFVF